MTFRSSSLGDNLLGEGEGRAIGKALEVNTTRTALHLGMMETADTGAVAIAMS